MVGRARIPSQRAIEARQRATELEAMSSSSSPPTRKPAAAAIRGMHGSRTGKADMADNDEDTVMDSGNHDGLDDEREPDLTLYCICLGFDTGEQPMIQCEHCNNWFHFSCIGLDKVSAAKIEAYVCDICSEMGQGTTRTIDTAALAPFDLSHLPAEEDASSPSVTGLTDDDEGEDDAEWTIENRDVDTSNRSRKKKSRTQEAEALAEGSQGRSTSFYGTSSTSTKAKTTAKRARSQSFLDDDDDSGEDIATKSKAKSRRPRKSAASPPAQPVDPANAPSAPATEKTRAHCIKQLTSLFVSIFSASDADDAASAAVEARAAAFAEDVESELFEGFSELDPKGVRSPKTKYISKFRSLHYNLKTNAAFRSRISANELTASQIVTMSSEDLLRPELRAMADSVRAASLKQSVKEVLAAPTAKRTHKGEEEIDNLATTVMAAEERLRAEEEQRMDHERSATEANGSPGPSPRVAQTSAFGESFSPSTSATVPSADSPAAHRKRASLAGVDLSADDIGLDHDGVDSFIDAREASTGDSPSVDTADGEMRPPPPPKSRSSFDMSSIFGRIKPRSDSASAEPESTTPDKSPPPDLSTDQEIDALEAILAGTRPRKTADDDDDFENKLLGGSGPQKDATPRPTLEDLPSVWRGDLIVPEEGGFPAFCVQAGGRPFGPSPDVWKRLLPPTFAMDGRIPTSTANKYLVECSFAPSRELIVLGVLPDLTGPTEESPYKPHKEACLVKHQHIVDLYVKKDRVGVIAPKGELRKVVKDIYFLPLKKDDPLPEYIDLLDDHDIPTSRHRENNLLLAVLVLQKGVIPTVPTVTPATKQPAPSSIASTTSGLPARTPVAATVATAGSDSPFPGFGATSNTASRPIQPVTVPSTVPVAAGAAPNPFAGIDTAALQSLLANPSILHGALAHSQAPMTAVPQYHHTPVQGPPYMPMQPPPPTMHAPQWRGPPAAGPSTTFSSYSPFGAGGHTPPTQMAGGMSPQGLPGISPAREASAAGGSSGGGRGGAYVHPSRAALLEGAGGSDIGGGARDSRGGGSPPYDQDYGSASRGRGGSRGGRGGYRGRGGSQQEFVPSGTGWGRGRGGR